MHSRNERYHALDCLRAFAMFLGILLHGAISFAEPEIPFWPVHDSEKSLVTNVAMVVVHDFRMQVFFVLAGLFSCLLYQRYDLAGMLRHRIKRIAVPFVLLLVTLIPILQAIWLIGDRKALAVVGFPVPEESVPASELIRQNFTTTSWLEAIRPFHLWFLYFLILFYLFMIPLILLGTRLQNSRPAIQLDQAFRWLIRWRWSAVVFGVALLPVLWPMIQLVVDTHNGWAPSWHLFAYYFLFFLFGWMLYRHRDLLGEYVSWWRSQLIVANVLVLGPMIVFTACGLEVLQGKPNRLGIDLVWIKLFAHLFGGMYTWLMISGLMGAFLRYFSRERAWVRYLADSSYWCYVASLAPLILMQIVVARWEMPGLLKFIVVCGASIALLLASYEWCVRYTIIGAILNGRRERMRRSDPAMFEKAQVSSAT
jgi:peptidoglycan/LPS O-acetylase OafA/YrhL